MDPLSPKSLAGMTVGALFGLLFLLTCLISIVKAVRDRRRIKARIEAKRAGLGNGNGHGPQTGSHLGRPKGKKGRPNILIIHDEERERRIKRGKASSGRAASGHATTPADLASCSTETTTVAEMSLWHCSGIRSFPISDPIPGDGETYSDGCCLLGKSSNKVVTDADPHVSTNMVEEAVLYRTSSSKNSSLPLVSTFPVSISTVVDSVPFNSRVDNGRLQSHGIGTKGFKQKYIVNGDRVSYTGQMQSFSFHGLASKSTEPRVSLCPESHREYGSADLSPRRNSYAADVTEPAWTNLNLPPLRRHSDEYRHIVNNSISRLYQNAVRMRRYRRDGADNPAYEALDDNGVINF